MPKLKLPGRCAIEIKNYWNTRANKCQQIGLSIYPKHVLMQTSNVNQRTLNYCNIGEKRGSKVLQGGMHALLDIEFDPLKTNPRPPSYSPPFSDLSLACLQSQGFGAQAYSFNPGISYAKRLREFESYFPGNHGSMASGQRMFEQLPHGPDSANEKLLSLGYSKPGSLIQSIGNFSPSRPLTGTVKLELPSLQFTETSCCSRPICPPPPPYQAIDTYLQSPLAISTQFNWASPASVLLETLDQGSPALSTEWKQLSRRSNYSAISPSVMPESSTANMCCADWKGSHDPTSPFYESVISPFNECAPISKSCLNELSDSGGPLEMPEPTSEQMSIPNAAKKDISDRLNAKY